MKTKQFIAGAIGAVAMLAAGVSNAAVVIEKKHKTIVVPNRAVKVVPRRYIGRDRVIEIMRGRRIRFVGRPYFYRGAYVLRCYDRFGRLAYCRIDPRTGAFLGIAIRL